MISATQIIIPTNILIAVGAGAFGVTWVGAGMAEGGSGAIVFVNNAT